MTKVSHPRTERAPHRQWAEAAHYQLVMESAKEAIVSADKRGDIINFNKAAERLFGYEAVEVLGQPLTVLMPARFQELHRHGLQRFLATGDAHVIGKTVELAARKKDGSEVPVEFSVASWQANGETYFTAFLRDISERKQAEQEICKAAARLEAANKELEAFSYSVSHDLHAPLRAMNGFSRILLQEYAPHLPEKVCHYLHVIHDNAQAMGRLIDDLLSFSRLSRHSLRKQCVAPIDLVRQVLADLRGEQENRCLEIIVGDLRVCRADPSLLRQVFANLLGNAVKYTRQREKAVIEVGCRGDGGHAGDPVYFVKDNGVGFDPRYAQKLFGVFQRLHRAEDYEGTGVGLAIVQRIVQRHGGRVWAEAEVNQGATFYFTLGNGLSHE